MRITLKSGAAVAVLAAAIGASVVLVTRAGTAAPLTVATADAAPASDPAPPVVESDLPPGDLVPIVNTEGEVAGYIPRAELYPADKASPFDGTDRLRVRDLNGRHVGWFVGDIGFVSLEDASIDGKVKLIGDCYRSFAASNSRVEDRCRDILKERGITD